MTSRDLIYIIYYVYYNKRVRLGQYTYITIACPQAVTVNGVIGKGSYRVPAHMGVNCHNGVPTVITGCQLNGYLEVESML